MTITHQTLMDANGNPTAALIPWPEFEAIQKRLAQTDAEDANDLDDDSEVTAEWSTEIHKRVTEIDNGTVDLVDGDDFLKRLRSV